MASGDPSPALISEIQKVVCQLCGQNVGNSSNENRVNYQKQVDEPRPERVEERSPYPPDPVPHPQPLFPQEAPMITHTPLIEYRVTSEPYSQIIPDSRYDEIEAYEKKSKGTKDQDCKKSPIHVCVQLPQVVEPSTVPAPQGNTDAKPKDKIPPKALENSPTVKGACLPTGGCPPPVKMMLCLPCPPPGAMQPGGFSSGSGQQSGQKKKPKDYTYRCESRELRGGNLYQCCQCIKRNGLQHDCPRTPCQGRAACLIKPWPDCWPSGGCHGIDYSREKGVKRYDPCKEQRFDKKECKPSSNSGNSGGSGNSGSGSGKPEMGGNVMVVLCPKPQQR